AEDYVVDAPVGGQAQRARHAWVELDRPHPRVEVEDHAQADLRGELGAIGVADVGQARGAEQDGVDRAAEIHRLAREVLPGPAIEGGGPPGGAEREPGGGGVRGPAPPGRADTGPGRRGAAPPPPPPPPRGGGRPRAPPRRSGRSGSGSSP